MKRPIRSRAELVTWIESCVLGDLRTLLVGVDAYYASPTHVGQDGRPLGAANVLLVAGCCSAIDYFAFLLNRGSSDEARAKTFIDTFLGPVDSRYCEVGLLIWRCFRHGTVHRSWPKRIILEADASSAVVTGAGTEANDPHLVPSPDVAGDSVLVNGRQLLLDLTRVCECTFRDWILTQSSDDVLERANPQDLLVRVGDTQALRQVETVNRWNREYRAIPSEKIAKRATKPLLILRLLDVAQGLPRLAGQASSDVCGFVLNPIVHSRRSTDRRASHGVRERRTPAAR